MPGAFSVEKGELKVSGGRAHIFYGANGDASFKNFEFKAKVKTTKGGNSGIYIHTAFEAKGWPSKGYECQVNSTHTDVKKTGGLYGVKDVLNNAPSTDDVWFDYYIKVKRSTAAKESVKKWSSVRQKIIAFQQNKKRIVLLKDVNEQFRMEFEEFCKKKEKLSANYFERILTFIKTICKHAGQNNIDISPQLHGLRAKKEAVHKIYLTREEIELLHKSKMPNDDLENSKDWLVISCNTAQRISDFMNFKKSDMVDIVDGSNRIQAIKITQQKTGKLLEIPVFKMVREILEKRGGEFPEAISDQRYNTNIKKICQLVGISEVVFGSKMDKKTKRLIKGDFPKYELVSSHIGRRSFATCQYGHLPNTHIMAYTGHSTEKQLLAYIGKPQAEVSKLSIEKLMSNGWI